MAVDTREERQSALGFLLPFHSRGVEPDPGIDQAERQSAALVYSGIAAEAPGAVNTREERQSAYGFLMPFYSRGVEPDPGIDQGERQSAGLIYSGIAAAFPGGAPSAGDVIDAIDIITHIRRVLR